MRGGGSAVMAKQNSDIYTVNNIIPLKTDFKRLTRISFNIYYSRVEVI